MKLVKIAGLGVLKYLPFFVIYLFNSSCGRIPNELKPEAYINWILDSQNGLLLKKSVNKTDLVVRFLPSEYQAYKEFQSSFQNVKFDSIWDAYKCGLSFQITLQADKDNQRYGNLMHYNLSRPEEVTYRIRFLSFNISEFISLRHGTTIYEPVLSHFEGFDQMGNKISFQVSFVIQEYQCGQRSPKFGDLTLVFDDPFWDLGINQFEFNASTIASVPRLKVP